MMKWPTRTEIMEMNSSHNGIKDFVRFTDICNLAKIVAYL